MSARPKWWLNALCAAAVILIGFAAASVGRADPGHHPGPDAKVAEYVFILHKLLVRPFVNVGALPVTREAYEDRYGEQKEGFAEFPEPAEAIEDRTEPQPDPSLPGGRVIVVSDIRPIGESRQLFIAGPQPFTATKGEYLQFEQRVYQSQDCTPYDHLIVQMDAYLIKANSVLPAAIAKLVRRGGLVAEGNGPAAQAVRDQLALLKTDPNVIPLGHYGGNFDDPSTDPERTDHGLSGSTGSTLRSRIQYEWTNQYEIGGPCGAGSGTSTDTTSTTTNTTPAPGATRCSYTVSNFRVRPATPQGYSTSEKVVSLSYDIANVSYRFVDPATNRAPGPNPFPGETWSVTTAEPQGTRAFRIVVTVQNPGSTTATGEKLWRLLLTFDRQGPC